MRFWDADSDRDYADHLAGPHEPPYEPPACPVCQGTIVDGSCSCGHCTPERAYEQSARALKIAMDRAMGIRRSA